MAADVHIQLGAFDNKRDCRCRRSVALLVTAAKRQQEGYYCAAADQEDVEMSTVMTVGQPEAILYAA
jgi:hypothetical protein